MMLGLKEISIKPFGFESIYYDSKIHSKNIVKNLTNIAGYIPGISVITGIARLFFALLYNFNQKNSRTLESLHICRAITEIFSVGYICLIADICFTFNKTNSKPVLSLDKIQQDKTLQQNISDLTKKSIPILNEENFTNQELDKGKGKENDIDLPKKIFHIPNESFPISMNKQICVKNVIALPSMKKINYEKHEVEIANKLVKNLFEMPLNVRIDIFKRNLKLMNAINLEKKVTRILDIKSEFFAIVLPKMISHTSNKSLPISIHKQKYVENILVAFSPMKKIKNGIHEVAVILKNKQFEMHLIVRIDFLMKSLRMINVMNFSERKIRGSLENSKILIDDLPHVKTFTFRAPNNLCLSENKLHQIYKSSADHYKINSSKNETENFNLYNKYSVIGERNFEEILFNRKFQNFIKSTIPSDEVKDVSGMQISNKNHGSDALSKCENEFPSIEQNMAVIKLPKVIPLNVSYRRFAIMLPKAHKLRGVE